MNGEYFVVTSIIVSLACYGLGVLSGSHYPFSVSIDVDFQGMIGSLLLSVVTGIISGIYVSMVVTRYLRFQEYIREASLLWYKIELEWSEEWAAHTAEIKDLDTFIRTGDKLLFIVAELKALGHSRAGDKLDGRVRSLLNEKAEESVEYLHQWLRDSVMDTKLLKPNAWALARVFKL